MLRRLLCVLCVLVAVLWGLACSETAYIYGECGEDVDCRQAANYGGGTKCVDGRCKCTNPIHAPQPCCPGGGIDCPNEEFMCRPAAECNPEGPDAGPDAPSEESAEPECATDTHCDAKGPPDDQCGVARCNAGVCELEVYPGPLPSQIRGDCKRRDCGILGGIITVDDPSDWYNDGRECTLDYCQDGEPINTPVWDGFHCPETQAGACYEGQCVECIFGIADICGNGYACHAVYCVPLACGQSVNGMKDPGLESGVDCGGLCVPCFNPQTCDGPDDCHDSVCMGGMCALPTHSDGVQNDGETGIDCGCASCAPCGDGLGCDTGQDCQSLVCWAGKCQAPSCFDGIQNGKELGEDCGGDCDPCYKEGRRREGRKD